MPVFNSVQTFNLYISTSVEVPCRMFNQLQKDQGIMITSWNVILVGQLEGVPQCFHVHIVVSSCLSPSHQSGGGQEVYFPIQDFSVWTAAFFSLVEKGMGLA